jgi:hypothetical protein
MRISNVAYGGEGKVTWNILNDDVTPPVNTVAPVVSATGRYSFASTDGTWDPGFPGIQAFSYQWQRFSGGSWNNVSDEIYQTYICRDADNGTTVRCVVSAIHQEGVVTGISNASSGITSSNVFVIPAGMVILYPGNYTGPVDGWELYTAGADKLICGDTDLSGTEGTTAGETGFSNSASFGSIAYGGNHAPASQTPTNSPGGYFSTPTVWFGGPGGQHLHVGANCSPATGLSTPMKPRHIKFTLLTNPSPANFLPAGCIQMSEYASWTDGTAFYAPLDETGNGRAAFVCGSNKFEYLPASASAHTFTWTTGKALNVPHSHARPTTPAQGSYRPAAYPSPLAPVNYGLETYLDNTTPTGGHNHTHTRTVSIKNIQGKLLKFWKITGRSIPKYDTVMIHTSRSSLLANQWKFCNGLDFSIDMRGQMLAIADAEWGTRYPQYVVSPSFPEGYAPTGYPINGAPTFATNPVDYTLDNPVATNNGNWPHYHARTAFNNLQYGSNQAGHTLENITHSHGVSSGTLSSTYIPGFIKLSFVQYRGPT